MDGSLRSRAEQLASEIASQTRTAENLNGLMRLMMKSALERMLKSELDVHLGRKALAPVGEPLAVPSNGAEPMSRELHLPDSHHALLLTISISRVDQLSLDGRNDGRTTRQLIRFSRIKYARWQPIKAGYLLRLLDLLAAQF